MSPRKTLGRLLQERRVWRQVGLRHLAESCGLSPQEWLWLERGHEQQLRYLLELHGGPLGAYRAIRHVLGPDQEILDLLRTA